MKPLLKALKVVLVMIPILIYRLIHFVIYFIWNFKLPKRVLVRSLVIEEKGADYGYIGPKYFCGTIFSWPLFSKEWRDQKYRECIGSWSTGSGEPQNLFFYI